MEARLRDRLVRVVSQTDPDAGGTGFLLSGDRVLTSRHVIEDHGPVKIHFRAAEKRADFAVPSGKPWFSTKSLDVAIVPVETGLKLPQLALDGRHLSADAPWRSKGWAMTSPDGGPMPADLMEDLAGTAFATSTTATVLSLKLSPFPKGVQWWEGVSGAPVFCGQRLVGVVKYGEEAYDGEVLRATPLSALWSDSEFRLHLGSTGSSAEREHRSRLLLSEMTKILAEDHRVRTLLVDHGLPSWVTAHRVGAAELAGAIYDTECWEDAANAFLRAYQNAEPTEVARSVLLDLLLMAGPGIYFRDFEDPADGSKLISLPFETDTHAEIAAAAYDGRRLRLQAVPDLGEYPGGLGRIPLRAPKRDNQDGGEAFRGWNLSEGGTARAWVPLLAQWANIAKSDRDRYAEDAVGLAERITTHFRNEVLLNPTEEPHKYLALPARVIAANREFFDDLCSLLQGLPIYVLEGSDSFNRERNEFGPVLVMLHDQWKRGPR